MLPENFNSELLCCRLCHNIISYTNSKAIEKDALNALEVTLPTLNLEEGHKHLMCKPCCSKLLAAFNFKSTCMNTEDIILPHISTGEISVTELKDIYLKVNRNACLTDIWENQKICRLCFQLITCAAVSLNEVDNGIIDTCIPQVNINATRDPVICTQCFNSLHTHGGFLNNCLTAHEEYKGVNKQPDIKTEEIKIKLEDYHDAQQEYENINEQSYITSEIEIKTEHGDQVNDSSSHDLDGETIENKAHISEDKEETGVEYMLECENKLHINNCGVQLHKCDACDYETKHKSILKRHQLTHKDPSEIQMHKCNNCNYETKYKSCLKVHQLTHKNPAEIQIYKCDVCDFGSKRKDRLKSHQLLHKDPSEVQVYKCNECTYETRYKRYLANHRLTHKDPSEFKIYKCDACDYECKRKDKLKSHMLLHKDPSEVQVYKCNKCTYETRYERYLNNHQIKHKDPSEIQMYRCDACNFVAKRKSDLRSHQLKHKDPSEIQMYKCNVCDYETKYKRHLKTHEAKHEDFMQIQMYKCYICTYQTRYKNRLKTHISTHKDAS